MPKKTRRSPAEKKALSYAKDRRNNYRANDKASRKAIPARKAKSHRAARRKAAAKLSKYETLNDVEADLTENALSNDVERFKRWAKSPDQPLSEHLKEQSRYRQWRDGRKVWVQEQRSEAEAKGHTSFCYSWRGSRIESEFDSD